MKEKIEKVKKEEILIAIKETLERMEILLQGMETSLRALRGSKYNKEGGE